MMHRVTCWETRHKHQDRWHASPSALPSSEHASSTDLYYVGNRGHSQVGYYFWDKGLKDYVAVDLGVYHYLLLFDQ